MENFEIPEDLTYTEKIRKFEPTDPAHADLLNMTVQALVNNITFLKRVLGKQGVDIQGQLQQQYEQLTGYTDTKIGELINGAPETLDTIKEVADAILENKNVAEALNEAVGKKLNKEGDASDTTVAFTSEDDENPAAWATMRKIVSGKLKDVLGSVSLMAKNLRYLRKLLGASDISKLADGTVTGALSKLNTDLDTTVRAVKSQEPLNAVKELKDKWDGLPIGVLLKTNVTTNFGNGPYVAVLYYKHELEEYGWALLLTYRFPRPVYVTLSAGVWREPVWV